MTEPNYPLPVFHFKVVLGNDELGFAEVSGLTIEVQLIEYRHGLMREMHPIKMPGIPKHGNITLKRGIVPSDNALFDWLNSVSLNKVDRKDVTISLLNEKHDPVMTWTAKRAWPVKVEGPSLKATGNEVAIESVEIAHEGLVIANE